MVPYRLRPSVQYAGRLITFGDVTGLARLGFRMQETCHPEQRIRCVHQRPSHTPQRGELQVAAQENKKETCWITVR